MTYTYAHSNLVSGNITQNEWRLYTSLYSSLTREISRPDLIIYLKTQVPILRDRIEKRGRPFEVEKYSIAYLKLVENSLKASIDRFKNDTPTRLLEITPEDDYLTQPESLLKKILQASKK